LLGTGSSTTIGNHLRLWKANQDSTSLMSAKENIPTELVAVMKGLWERVTNHSEEQVAKIENDYQKIISDLKQEVEKYKTNSQRWQKMYEQWVVEKNQLSNDKLTLEQALEFAQTENISLHSKQDALFQQVQDKQDRIDELHRLHKQTQENLEHYRESTREQKLMDQQQYEQQKQQLQFEIKNLNEQLVVQRDKTNQLQQQNQILIQSNTTLEQNNAYTQSQLTQIDIKLQETEKTKNEHLSASLHWQNRYNESQNKLDLKMSQFIAIQTENKLLLQQQIEIKESLKKSQDQNNLLSHEKWEIGQEKSHLEGRLRQMQDRIVT
ncbi:MAG: DNA-binding protein, partial [Gammaproteobacteria bacterium]